MLTQSTKLQLSEIEKGKTGMKLDEESESSDSDKTDSEDVSTEELQFGQVEESNLFDPEAFENLSAKAIAANK